MTGKMKVLCNNKKCLRFVIQYEYTNVEKRNSMKRMMKETKQILVRKSASKYQKLLITYVWVTVILKIYMYTYICTYTYLHIHICIYTGAYRETKKVIEPKVGGLG